MQRLSIVAALAAALCTALIVLDSTHASGSQRIASSGGANTAIRIKK